MKFNIYFSFFLIKLSLISGLNLFHNNNLRICDNFNDVDRLFCENFMLASHQENLKIDDLFYSERARRVMIYS